MKITFLGTSHGLPEADRFCSATLLEIGEAVYLIDAGAPVADLLIRHGIAFNRIRAVFTTHMHGDHTFGLISLLSLCSWYKGYADASFDVFLAEDAGIEAFRAAVLATDGTLADDRIHLRKTAEGVFYSDDFVTVTAVPTKHMGASRPSYALIIDTCEEKRIVFTGDLRYGDAADFPLLAKEQPSEAIVCEMAHFMPEIVFPHLAACPTKRVFVNHIGLRRAEIEPILREANETKQLGYPIQSVADGDSFEL